MDIISINKTMTKESKQTKTKTFVFVVALKRAVLNGSTKSRFKIFLELFVRGLTFSFIISDFTRLSIEVIEYARFQNTYFGMITVSLDVRIVNVLVFTAI